MNVVTLEGYTDWVWTVFFSPDETMLACSGVDGNIILWKPTLTIWASGPAVARYPIK
jgi:WD40 repeat protein